MKNRKPTGPVAESVRELVAEIGYAVVDFSAERVKGRTHVHCVLHHSEGINLDALGEVHATLQPRLEALLEDDDLYIEFSSPGIERTFKSFHEFSVFRGATVRILPTDASEWIQGRIEDADDQRCVLVDESGHRHEFSPETAAKARLTE